MKQYYVYELIDPTNRKPFYIGKGSGKRMYYHFNRVLNNNSLDNKHLENKLKKLIKQKLKPIYRKILETYDEQKAFNIEKEKIKEIGRNNLCNLTDGGEGPAGCIRSIETIEKIRNKALERNKDEKYRVMISEKTKSAMNRPEVKEKFLNICASPEFKNRRSETMIQYNRNNPGYHSGKNNPMYGKKLTHEHIEKRRKTIIERGSYKGENNPMYGKSVYDIWVDKYGVNIANEKLNIMKQKLKEKRNNR